MSSFAFAKDDKLKLNLAYLLTGGEFDWGGTSVKR